MAMTFEAAHESAHIVAGTWSSYTLKSARVQGCGQAGLVRMVRPDDDGERRALGDALYSVAGLAGELMAGYAPDEARAEADLHELRHLYQRWKGRWPWATDFEHAKAVLLVTAEQALLDHVDHWKSVASRLLSHDVVVADDLATLGPFPRWLAPGTHWAATFADLVDRGHQRLTAENQARDKQADFRNRYAKLVAQIRLREPLREDSGPTYHAPRVAELMARWGR
jgi:hypothetical protein